MSDRKVVLAARVLYDPNGNPLPEDERSDWQRHWDREFRSAMSVGNSPLAQAMRDYMHRRDRDAADAAARANQPDEFALGPMQQKLSDAYDEKVEARKLREVKKVYSFGKSKDGSKGKAK